MDDYICDDITCEMCVNYRCKDEQVSHWEYLKQVAIQYQKANYEWDETHEFIAKL